MVRKCQALDSEGNKCNCNAKYSVQYHGDSEIHTCLDEDVVWVQVYVCDKHVPKYCDKKKIK